MFRTTLFRKQLLILLLATIAFAGIAMFVSDLAVRTMMAWSVREDTSGGPTRRYVRLLDELTADGKLSLEEAAEKIRRSEILFRGRSVSVFTAEELHEQLSIDPNAVPQDSEQAYSLREKDLRPPRTIVFRSKLEPSKFIVFQHEQGPEGAADRGPRGRPGGGPGVRPPPLFLWNFAALIASGFLAAAISLFFLFSSMRGKAKNAAAVITAIKQGELQRRMPIDGLDEVGHLMQEFNRMADEIESAVKSLKRSEEARTNLLQDLAHDLRTPIASLRGLVETLEMRQASLDEKTKGELFVLAQKEIDYFARLVEDLLFLAQVKDPRYLSSAKPVDLAQLLREQVDLCKADPKVGKHIELSLSIPPETEKRFLVQGDPVLLQRMIRNALNNAASFAKNSVHITLEHAAHPRSMARLLIKDDGPGFSPEALKSFGEKRFSRYIAQSDTDASEESPPPRLSVGLGSVIMATVASVHGGQLAARNASQGAEIQIELPIE
ncbi:MAG: HAMP domain-containing sensor histidine kinase [Bdellovibrionales bacterium]|jgi:signal transduction histidine kinase|nr:HAMP domain-containing sensor histidine kinase [Bdellovibrionales bacterium]